MKKRCRNILVVFTTLLFITSSVVLFFGVHVYLKQTHAQKENLHRKHLHEFLKHVKKLYYESYPSVSIYNPSYTLEQVGYINLSHPDPSGSFRNFDPEGF